MADNVVIWAFSAAVTTVNVPFKSGLVTQKSI